MAGSGGDCGRAVTRPMPLRGSGPVPQSAVLLLEDASGEKIIRGGRVNPVGEELGVVVLDAAPPTAILGVPEDPEARAGERLVGARDHALDHGGRHDGAVVAVQGEVDIPVLLLKEKGR